LQNKRDTIPCCEQCKPAVKLRTACRRFRKYAKSKCDLSKAGKDLNLKIPTKKQNKLLSKGQKQNIERKIKEQ
jgi:hypothetical protein